MLLTGKFNRMNLCQLKQLVKKIIVEATSMNPLLLEKHYRPDGRKIRSFVAVFRFNPLLEVLLVMDKKGRWTLPGGQLDVNETPEQAAKRELHEETHVDPDKIIFWKTIEDDEKITHLFHALVPTTEKAKPGTDAKKTKWALVDDLDSAGEVKNFHKQAIHSMRTKYRPGTIISQQMKEAMKLGLPVRLPIGFIMEGKKRTEDGYLIVMEGIDGSGKSTQAENLRKWLENKGWKVTVSKWNQAPHITDAIKKGKKERWLTPMLFSLLNASDMTWRYENVIKPALDKGHVVICDRFYYTSYVRDSLRGVSPVLLDEIYKSFPEPDMVLHFKVSPKLAVERLLKDKGFKWYSSGRDIGYDKDEEKCALQYETKMDEAYGKILTKVKNYKEVHTERSIDEIFKELKESVREKLKKAKRSKFKKMIIKESIKEINDTLEWRYWWMDPDLKLHPVEHEGHAGFAIRYLNNLTEYPPGFDTNKLKYKDKYYMMFALGWVRLGVSPYQGKYILTYNYDPDIPLKDRQKRAINNFAKEIEADEIRDNTLGKWEFIDETLEYPMAKGDDIQAYGGDVDWKGKIVWMTPDRFLQLAAPLSAENVNQHAIDYLEKRFKEQLPTDFLVLEVDMNRKKVIAHEGRHRAMVAKKLGMEKVPVLIYTGSGFERVPKWDKETHDVVDKADFAAEK